MAESRDSSPICGYDEPRPPRPPFVPPLDLPPDLGEENSDEEVTSSDDLTSIRSHDNGSRPPRPDFVPPLDLTKLLSEEDDEDKTNNSGKTYFAAYPVDFPPRYVIPQPDYHDIMAVLDTATISSVPEEYHEYFLKKVMAEMNKKDPKPEGEKEYTCLYPVLVHKIIRKYIKENFNKDSETPEPKMITIHDVLESGKAQLVAEHYRKMQMAVLYKRQLEREVYNQKFQGRVEYGFYKEKDLIDLPRGPHIGPENKMHLPPVSPSPLCLFDYRGEMDENDGEELQETQTEGTKQEVEYHQKELPLLRLTGKEKRIHEEEQKCLATVGDGKSDGSIRPHYELPPLQRVAKSPNMMNAYQPVVGVTRENSSLPTISAPLHELPKVLNETKNGKFKLPPIKTKSSVLTKPKRMRKPVAIKKRPCWKG